MKISVITPSLPGRATLADAIRSVHAQTLVPVEHLIGVDYWTVGPSLMRNRLSRAANGDWLAFLDDDDTWYPAHLETLAGRAADDDVDVVWSLNDGRPLTHYCNVNRIHRANHIPVTALVRRSVFEQVNGFPVSGGGEDALLWRKIHSLGGRFACVHETTWTYGE